ncbi:MAG TPA: ClpX C4-type zinc finger protein [Blastocatellia bacterium]|nr:ClpX C4-type zinc finger protein [Blastocatellia bacterium]HMX25304.1 ClpX C4-type zinc finger protein [Blastocatellia bacterium]HMY76154.1 ClpX C4-type zinc finger protein [Blastocatellia bacterium]HMZ21615.1 ClpX C4-type zinc finger protein [Blastocatellia bacterium]HNG28279.1 ClpX C4-type zinc finger protein [Blastocatellia bacterium]
MLAAGHIQRAMNDRTPSVYPHVEPGEALYAQPQQPVLRCSFCGLGEGEVARLFEGTAGFICDECVEVCVQLLHDYHEMGIRPPRPNQPWYKKLFSDESANVAVCSFNVHDRNNPQGERVFPGLNAQICNKCIRACEMLKSSLLLGG